MEGEGVDDGHDAPLYRARMHGDGDGSSAGWSRARHGMGASKAALVVRRSAAWALARHGRATRKRGEGVGPGQVGRVAVLQPKREKEGLRPRGLRENSNHDLNFRLYRDLI